MLGLLFFKFSFKYVPQCIYLLPAGALVPPGILQVKRDLKKTRTTKKRHDRGGLSGYGNNAALSFPPPYTFHANTTTTPPSGLQEFTPRPPGLCANLSSLARRLIPAQRNSQALRTTLSYGESHATYYGSAGYPRLGLLALPGTLPCLVPTPHLRFNVLPSRQD